MKKKSFALILSIAMVLSLVVTAFFAISLATGAATVPSVESVTGTPSSAVKVFLTGWSGDTDYELLESGDSLTTTDGLTAGSMSFANGTLTLNGVSGVAKVESEGGTLIVNVNGENVFSNPGQNRIIRSAGTNANIVVTSSTNGKLTATNLAYALYAQGHIFVTGNVTLDVTVAQRNCFQTTGTGNIVITDNAKVRAIASSTSASLVRSLQAAGSVYIAGNAEVTAEIVKSTYAVEASNGIIQISGNAKLTAKALYRAIYAKGAATGVYILDDASVTAENTATSADNYGAIETAGTTSAVVEISSSKSATITGGKQVAVVMTGAGTADLKLSGGNHSLTSTGSYGVYVSVDGAAKFDYAGGSSTISSAGKNALILNSNKASSTATLSGGALTVKNTNGIAFLVQSKAGNAVANVTGGTGHNISATGGYAFYAFANGANSKNAEINISGGTLTSTSSNTRGLMVQAAASTATATANISGGRTTVNYGSDGLRVVNTGNGNKGTTNITGGVIEFNSTKTSAISCSSLNVSSGATILAGDSKSAATAAANAASAVANKYASFSVGEDVLITTADNSLVNLTNGTSYTVDGVTYAYSSGAVTVTGNASLKSIEVKADKDITLNLPSTVTVSGAITSAKKVTLAGTSTLTVGSVAVKELAVAQGAVITVSGNGLTSSSDLVLSGKGTLKFNGTSAITAPDLEIRDLTVDAILSGNGITVNGSSSATMKVSGSAAVKVVAMSSGKYGIKVVSSAGKASFQLTDTAYVDVKSNSVALWVDGKKNEAILTSSSALTRVERNNNGKSFSGAAFYLAGNKAGCTNDVTIKNGTYTFVGTSQNIGNGVVNIGNNRDAANGKTTVTISDNATVTVNNTVPSSSGATIANALRLNGTSGSALNVSNATVNVVATSEKTSEIANNALLSYNVSVNLSGSAAFNVSAAMKVANDDYAAVVLNGSALSLADEAKVTVTSDNNGIVADSVSMTKNSSIQINDAVNGVQAKTVTLEDSAKIAVTKADKVGVYGTQSVALTDSSAVQVDVSGNGIQAESVTAQGDANISVTAGGYGIYALSDAEASFALTERATATVTSTGVALFVTGKTANNVTMTTSEDVSLTRTAGSGAAMFVDPIAKTTVTNVEFANGRFNIVADATYNEGNGVVNIGQNSAWNYTTQAWNTDNLYYSPVNVTVKDAMLNIVSNYVGGGNDNSALRLNGSDGSTMKILGNAIVDVTMDHAKTDKTIYAIRNYGVDISVSDNAVLNATATAATATEDAASILLMNADLNVQGNASVSALSPNGGYGVNATDGSKVNVESGVIEMYGGVAAVTSPAVKKADGAVVYAGTSVSGALTKVDRTFPYAYQYVIVTAGNAYDAPVVTVTMTDGTVYTILRNAPCNTATLPNDGTVVYDSTTGVLTLNKLTADVASIHIADASVTVQVKGDNTLGGTGITSDRSITVTGDTLNLTGTNGFKVVGMITLADDLKVNINTSGTAVATTGDNSGVEVKDNVVLNVKTTGSAAHGLYVNPANTGIGNVIVSDAATVNVESTGVSLYMEGAATNNLLLTTTGEAFFHRTDANATVYLYGKTATVELKNGTYKFTGRGGNVHNGLFRIDGGSGSGDFDAPTEINFTIEDADVTFSRTGNNTVSTALRLIGAEDSTMKIKGDSNVTVTCPSTQENAVVTGIYADGVDVTVSDESILNVKVSGEKSAETSAAIFLKGAELNLEGKAMVDAVAANAGFGVDNTNGTVNVAGGILEASGTKGIADGTAVTVGANSVIRAGANRQESVAVTRLTGDDAYVLINAGNVVEMPVITVTLSDGTVHTFTKNAPGNELTWDKGKITYDYATNTLTLDNASEIENITVGKGSDLTVKVKGKNSILSESHNPIKAVLEGGKLIFVGDGTLDLKYEKSALLVQMSGTLVFRDKVTVNAIGGTAGIYNTGDAAEIGVFVEENATVNAQATNLESDYAAVYVAANKGNAVVEVSGGELNVTDSNYGVWAKIGTEGKTASISASGNGKLNVDAAEIALFADANDIASAKAEVVVSGNAVAKISASGLDTGSKYVIYPKANGTDAAASVTVADNASLTVDAGIAYRAVYATSKLGTANLTVSDAANFKATNSSNATVYLTAGKEMNVNLTTTGNTTVIREGNANGAALFVEPAGANCVTNVNIENGMADFIGASGGVNNAVVNIGENDADPFENNVVNVNIESAYVTVTNKYTGGTTESVGLRIFGTDGFVKIHENSIVLVDVYTSKTGANAYGLFDSGADITLSDTSVLAINTSGKKTGENGAAILLRHADLTITDKADLDAKSNNGGYGISITTGNNVYLKGGITELFGSAVTDNIIALKRGEDAIVLVGDSAATATSDFRTFSGLEKYAKINVGNLPEHTSIYVTMADSSTKILKSAPWNTLKVGEGTLTYDPATSTLTMENVVGIKKILSQAGDLVVDVKGVNSIQSTDSYGIVVDTVGGDLTVKGDGVLNIETKNYALASLKGNLTVTGDVTVNAEGDGPVIYVAGYTDDEADLSKANQTLTFSGNAKVTAKGTGAAIVRNASASGFTYVKDNAQVTVVNSEPASWASAMDTANFEISGGVLDLTASGSKNTAFVGLAVSVQKPEMEAGAKAGVANFLGGKVILNVKNDSAVETDGVVADSRGYGLFFKNLETVDFAGTDIDVTVTNKTGTVDAQKVNNRAAVTWQSDNGVKTQLTMTAGTLKITADKNTAGLLGAAGGSSFIMKGGSIMGEAATLFAAGAGKVSYTVTGGMVDFKAHGSIVGTASKPTVKVEASILRGAADTKATVLVIGNPATVALPVAIIMVTALGAVAGAILILRKRRKAIQ